MSADEIGAALKRIEGRQELIASGLRAMSGTLGAVRDKLDELIEWANTPASSDLPDTLASLARTVDALREMVENRLPELVADGVRHAR